MLPSVLDVVLVAAIPVGAAFPGALTAALRPPGRVVGGGERRSLRAHRADAS